VPDATRFALGEAAVVVGEGRGARRWAEPRSQPLGITFIAARCPKAKGRVERLWGVLWAALANAMFPLTQLEITLTRCSSF
jgi:hypothetical protein